MEVYSAESSKRSFSSLHDNGNTTSYETLSLDNNNYEYSTEDNNNNYCIESSKIMKFDHNSRPSMNHHEVPDEDDLPRNADGSAMVMNCDFPGCLKEFNSRWSLTRHIRTHTGEKPFHCNECDKRFIQKSALKRHEKTHCDEREWICDHLNCGKTFKLKEYLEVHKRTHLKLSSEPSTSIEHTTETTIKHDNSTVLSANLIDSLRQRLVRSTVRNQELITSYNHTEKTLLTALQECSYGLQVSLTMLLQDRDIKTIPSNILGIAKKYAIYNEHLIQHDQS